MKFIKAILIILIPICFFSCSDPSSTYDFLYENNDTDTYTTESEPYILYTYEKIISQQTYWQGPTRLDGKDGAKLIEQTFYDVIIVWSDGRTEVEGGCTKIRKRVLEVRK